MLPGPALARLHQAVGLQQAGRLAEAEAIYLEVLAAHPGQFDCLHLLGVIALQTGRGARAVELLGEAVAANERVADAHANLGHALFAAGRTEDAIATLQRALALEPRHAQALVQLGLALARLARWDEAIASHERAVALAPENAQVHVNLGIALHGARRHAQAVASFDRALQLAPRHAPAHADRGVALQALGRFDEALASLDRAVDGDPAFADAWANRGLVLLDLRRPEDAIESCERALALKPGSALAWTILGNGCQALRQRERAVASYDRAIALDPGHADAHANRGHALQELNRPDEAAASFEQALRLRPGFPYARGQLLHARMLACDWTGLDTLHAEVCREIEQGLESATPFGLQGICRDEALLRRAAMIYSDGRFPPRPRETAPRPAPAKRIRVGYLCGEFREQATSLLMAGVWDAHDRAAFELVAFDSGWSDGSPMRRRIERAFDAFVDISRFSDAAAADAIRARGIDILVNLNGFFGHARQGVFALRPAAIQVNYLGFPGTVGSASLDYLVADRVVVPPASRAHYAEKLVTLPHCYQANDAARPVSDRAFTRAEMGLPEGATVFCCFNNAYKITPPTFDAWMNILRAVEGSVLWLIEDSPASIRNLRREAAARGVDGARLVFAKRLPPAEHLARHRLADLFLDTLPYNAHTTASDALWAGLPLLTQTGTTFPGRVATSLLMALGLPELVTTTTAAYEAKAIALARDPAQLQALREKIARRRLESPLYDTTRFTRHLEAAYRAMLERERAGLAPDHLEIAA